MADPVEERLIALVIMQQYIRHNGGNPDHASMPHLVRRYPEVFYDIFDDAGVIIDALDRHRARFARREVA